MNSIKYPNKLASIVVLGYKKHNIIKFIIRPKNAGLYRFILWPKNSHDIDLMLDKLLFFKSNSDNPVHVTFELTEDMQSFYLWKWALLPTDPLSTISDDFLNFINNKQFGISNKFRFIPNKKINDVRCVAWSCHQPYDARNNRLIINDDTEKILKWYENIVKEFKPHVIWGQGDTAYSDGTDASNFVDQVYDKKNWFKDPNNKQWLYNEYRNMYRYFWSFTSLRNIMSQFPHIFMWDDHEIHDGWGSEKNDQRVENTEIFYIAKQIANEYILNAGPRVRENGLEAHQSYVLGSLAVFIFDTRSTRNYYSNNSPPLISNEQYEDFIIFMNSIRNNKSIRYVVTCTTVPFVGLRSWVTEFITRLPNFIDDSIISISDDVRDTWTSPNNMGTLLKLLAAMRSLMYKRPDIKVINISGDIHVANAFKIYDSTMNYPIYQITTSALTNRKHSPGLIRYISDIPDHYTVPKVGKIEKIWDTITDPNVLFMDLNAQHAKFTLKVWNKKPMAMNDLTLVI